MIISNCYKNKKQVLSFEIFPPKKEANISKIYTVLEEVFPLNPDFISVTYGTAGAGVPGKTAEIAQTVQQKYKTPALAHLTCAFTTRGEIKKILEDLTLRGVKNVLALRGEYPKDGTIVKRQDYNYACDLIRHIKKENSSFSVGAATYPEGHINCDDMYESITHMRAKQDAGADFFLTQLFFDNDLFFRFFEATRACGINKPISAGIMPILNRKQIERMIFMCGVSLPSRIIKLLYKYENDEVSLRKAGIEYAARQAQELLRNKVDGIHIYTMNQPDIAQIISDYVRARDFK